MATGIKDKVAIIGMGCSKFGERWDASADDLMMESYTEAMADAGITTDDLGMAWRREETDPEPRQGPGQLTNSCVVHAEVARFRVPGEFC